MTYHPEQDRMEPILELWIDARTSEAATVRCAGRLDAATRRSLLSTVYDLMDSGALDLVVDVEDLTVEGPVGANTLSVVQRIARAGGADVHWRGVSREMFVSEAMGPAA